MTTLEERGYMGGAGQLPVPDLPSSDHSPTLQRLERGQPDVARISATDESRTPQSAFEQDDTFDTAARSHSQTSGSGRSLVSRAQRRSEALREFFGLSQDDDLIESFNCALRQKILLQGHLYVFQRSICFHCNIFGYVQKRVVLLKDVNTVRKRKSYGLPNAIEVEYGGQTDLYTSFLNRKDAYRQIVAAWGSSCEDGALVLSASQRVVQRSPADKGEGSSDDAGSQGKWVRRCATARPVRSDADPSGADPSGRGYLSFRSDRERNSEDDDPAELANEHHAAPAGASQLAKDTAASAAGQGSGRQVRGQPLPTEDVEAAEEEPGEADESLDPIQGDPPPLAQGMALGAEGTWDFTTQAALLRVFSEQSPFWKEWHEGRGDKDVKFTPWQDITGSKEGRVRQLRFVTPFQGALRSLPMAPKEAPCQQTHRLRLFSGDRLVFEYTQHISGIPMGDLFKVEVRWDITPVAGEEASRCQVKTYARVVFSKSTWLKGTIEKHTASAVKEAQADFIVKANRSAQSPFQALAQQQRGKRSKPRGGKTVAMGGIRRSGSLRSSGGQLDRRRSAGLSQMRSGSFSRGESSKRAGSNLRGGHDSIDEHRLSTTQLPDPGSPRGSQRTPTNGKSLLGQPSGHTSGDATQPAPSAAGLTSSSLLLLSAVGAVILLQVISLLRPAKVQMGLVAPSAQHVTGLLQHVEQMLVILKEMHQQLKQAHAMSS